MGLKITSRMEGNCRKVVNCQRQRNIRRSKCIETGRKQNRESISDGVTRCPSMKTQQQLNIAEEIEAVNKMNERGDNILFALRRQMPKIE